MYDTVMITPDALADNNFNKINSVEGSGMDFVHFRIPVSGINGVVSVKARLFYQTVAPKFLDEMFALNSASKRAASSTFSISRNDLSNRVIGPMVGSLEDSRAAC